MIAALALVLLSQVALPDGYVVPPVLPVFQPSVHADSGTFGTGLDAPLLTIQNQAVDSAAPAGSSPFPLVSVQWNTTALDAGVVTALQGAIEASTSVAAAQTDYVGVLGTAFVPDSGTVLIDNMHGVYGQTFKLGSGSIPGIAAGVEGDYWTYPGSSTSVGFGILGAFEAQFGGTTSDARGTVGQVDVNNGAAITKARGLAGRIDMLGTGTITTAYVVQARNGITASGITGKAGLVADEMTTGTNNTDLLVGSGADPAVPAGNWSLYSYSQRQSFIDGGISVGGDSLNMVPTATWFNNAQVTVQYAMECFSDAGVSNLASNALHFSAAPVICFCGQDQSGTPGGCGPRGTPTQSLVTFQSTGTATATIGGCCIGPK